MIGLIARRLVEGIPLLLIVCTLSFFLVALTPGSPAGAILGTQATPESIAALEEKLGLNRPIFEQYIEYLGGLFRGDLGRSWTGGQSVIELVMTRLPVTVSVAAVATILSLIVGAALGTFAALRAGWLDRSLTWGSGLGQALPNFWLAGVLVLFFSLTLGWFPATGYVRFDVDPGAWFWHLILPSLALGAAMVSAFARQTRSGMSEQLRSEHVRFLRSQGLPRWRIVWVHALRGAALAPMTTVGLQFVGALGGAIVVEQVFALPGLGQLVTQGATTHDVPIIQGVVVVSAVVVLLVNLLIDVIVLLLDPKGRRA